MFYKILIIFYEIDKLSFIKKKLSYNIHYYKSVFKKHL